MRLSELLDYLEPPVKISWEQPPVGALEFFRAKGLRQTFSYRDMTAEEHSVAFTVAKMMDTDMLADVKASLDAAMQDGTPFKEWAKGIRPLLEERGWWGKAPMQDPLTGRVIEAQLGSPWRLETIFRTNMQSAYSVGEWEQVRAQESVAGYLMYDAVDDFRTRPAHKAHDGKVLPVNDEFWKYWHPPNGYNCRCSVIQLSAEEVEDLGLTVSRTEPLSFTSWTNPRTGVTEQVPVGIDPGFAYNPGEARVQELRRLAREKADALPPPLKDAAADGLAAADRVANPPPVPRIPFDATTDAGKWNTVAWDSAPDYLYRGVYNIQYITVSRAERGAHFSRAKVEINMDPSYQTTSADNVDTWRHEFGHWMDNYMSGQLYDFRSAKQDFVDVIDAEARDLKKRTFVTTTRVAKKRAALLDQYETERTNIVDLDGSGARDSYLRARASEIGLDLEEIRSMLRRNSEVTLDGISGQVTIARIIRAIRNRDPQSFLEFATGKVTGSARTIDEQMITAASWRKGQLGCVSDLFGAMTKNSVCDYHSGFFGHETSYYQKDIAHGPTEVFANLTAVTGGPDRVLYEIVRRFAPALFQKYEDILRAYFR